MRLLFTLVVLGALLSACSEKQAFKLESETNIFKQNEPKYARKIDILWVIDNSGSMQNSQQNLAKNFDSFISSFIGRNLDFQMAVTTTEAYKDLYVVDPMTEESGFSDLRDGNEIDGPSGHSIVNQNTPDLKANFLSNILQGIMGAGDERPFQSIVATLDNANNDGFLREGSFLAVIIVSDEDDFSHDGKDSIGGQYSNPELHVSDDYYQYLDDLTRGDSLLTMFSVSAIAIPDKSCLDNLIGSGGGQKIGQRLMELVDKTQGIIGDICSDFSKSLKDISGKILSLATQFPLNRTPDVKTIVVKVDGSIIPRDNENGWSYNTDSNSIIFNGEAIPNQGAEIKVDFTPITARPKIDKDDEDEEDNEDDEDDDDDDDD